MATLETAQYALEKSTRANTSRLATANVSSGDIQYAIIKYALTGSEASADVLNLCILPAGIIPVPELSTVVVSADPGTTLTIDVGTDEDLDGWADGVALGAVTTPVPTPFTTPALPAWGITNTAIAADTNSGNAIVKATLVTVSAPTAAVVLKFVLAYKRGKG